MATVVYKDAAVFFAGVDLSAQLNETTLDYGAEMLDATTFGQTTRIRAGGLKTDRVSMRGFWDADTVSFQPDLTLFEEIGVDDRVVTLFPDGITEGSTGAGSGYAFKVVAMSYVPGGTVGELLAFTFTAEGRGIAA